MDDPAAWPVQQRVRQHPVPSAAAVLQVAAGEGDLPDPMARPRAPKVNVTAVPVFTSVELSELEKACQGRSFAARRDAAIIAVFTATGIRLSELAGIRYHPDDPAAATSTCTAGRSGSAARATSPGPSRSATRRPAASTATWGPHPARTSAPARAVAGREQPRAADRDRHLPGRRPPRAASGVNAYPHRFRHHFSHTWLDRGGAERDLMELNGWTSPKCSPGTVPAPAAPAPAAATTASWTTPDPAIAITQGHLPHGAESPPATPIAESVRPADMTGSAGDARR